MISEQKEPLISNMSSSLSVPDNMSVQEAIGSNAYVTVNSGVQCPRFACQFCMVSLLDYSHLIVHELTCPFKILSSNHESPSQILLTQMHSYRQQYSYDAFAPSTTAYNVSMSNHQLDMMNWEADFPAILRDMERMNNQTLQRFYRTSLFALDNPLSRIGSPEFTMHHLGIISQNHCASAISTTFHDPLLSRWPSSGAVSSNNHPSTHLSPGGPIDSQLSSPHRYILSDQKPVVLNSIHLGKRPFNMPTRNEDNHPEGELKTSRGGLSPDKRVKKSHLLTQDSVSTSVTSTDPSSFETLSSTMRLSIPLDDKSLTPLQCFIRNECISIFTADESDIESSSRGKRRPVNRGQVGICCSFCRSKQSCMNSGGGVYYPWSVSSLYSGVMNLIQRHFFNCQYIPHDIREKYCNLKQMDARSAASKAYWSSAALKLGLVDTPSGIRLSADILRVSETERDLQTLSRKNNLHEEEMAEPEYLCLPEHQYLTTSFTYALMRQMTSCKFTSGDRLGKRKELPIGFPGIACRHCKHDFVTGRFFPSTLKTLSDTSKTLDVLHRHILKCRNCPQSIKDELNELRIVHAEERASMTFGCQKTFFKKIWNRLHSNF
jgi:hypothetical protein